MGNRTLKIALLVMLPLLALLCGTTFALMFRQTEALDNRFEPAAVTCEIAESFDGTTKSTITVRNTGTIDAYLRVRLVTYWVDSGGNILAGTPSVPGFSLGANWISGGENTYYYKTPVPPGGSTGNLLGSSISLAQDAETGRYQVIEVFADAIQSNPGEAVTKSWGVTLSGGSITAAP